MGGTVNHWFTFLADGVYAGPNEELYDPGELNENDVRPEDMDDDEYERRFNRCE